MGQTTVTSDPEIVQKHCVLRAHVNKQHGYTDRGRTHHITTYTYALSAASLELTCCR